MLEMLERAKASTFGDAHIDEICLFPGPYTPPTITQRVNRIDEFSCAHTQDSVSA